MLRAGFDLAERVLSYPLPVVIDGTGHAIAMGVFLLLSGDYRVGATGPYKFTANEVAIVGSPCLVRRWRSVGSGSPRLYSTGRRIGRAL